MIRGHIMQTTEEREEITRLYRATTDKATRRRLQASVVAAYRPSVASLARKLAPAAHVEEATQAGCIGLLLALERFDPEVNAHPFRRLAMSTARREIRSYVDSGLYWRKRLAVAPQDRAPYGVGALLEIVLASGRVFEVEVKTSNRKWATLGEFREVLAVAAETISEPAEGC